MACQGHTAPGSLTACPLALPVTCLGYVRPSFGLHPHFAFGHTEAPKTIQQLDPQLGGGVSPLGHCGNGRPFCNEVAFEMPLILRAGEAGRDDGVL